MYTIALCDDEAVFRDQLGALLTSILAEMDVAHHIDYYASSAPLLEKYRRGEGHYQLLLLDVLMDAPNGIELATAIRDLDENVSIVFTTSSAAHALPAYRARPLHYLQKPVDREELKKVLTYDYRHRQTTQFLTVNSCGVWRRLPLEDIYYLEISGRKVAIHTQSDTLQVAGRLAEMEDALPHDRFVRCHQSFMVNIERVREVTRSEAVLVDGRRVPVSRSHLARVQQAFLRAM
ncbi:MAG: LytR/AlgR family response regulator transcription factor [Oscillospiraceae bacterium]